MDYKLVCVSLTLLLFGCTQSQSNSQMANPASANCVNQGFELMMKENANGTVGYCVFPSGNECEEWAYLRGECFNNSRTNCEYYNGTWLGEFSECEGISESACTIIGGSFNECASACRHNPESQVCTLQCVIVCKL